MATRFYFAYDGPRLQVAAATAGTQSFTSGPAPQFGYGYSLVTAKSALYANMAAAVQVSPVTATPINVLLGWFFSPPLQPQDIIGTVKGQIRVMEDVAGADCMAQLEIAVMRPDGTIRGWLWNGDPAAAVANEFATTLTNRQFPNGGVQTINTVSSVAGDRLVVMLAHRTFGAVGNVTYDLTANTGTDLPEDNTTTTAGIPWIEFNDNILFEAETDWPMWNGIDWDGFYEPIDRTGQAISAPFQVARVSVWTR